MEYRNKSNSHPKCDPPLRLLNSKGEDLLSNNPIRDTIRFIKQGKIVAIKGLGGFHLVCEAEKKKLSRS